MNPIAIFFYLGLVSKSFPQLLPDLGPAQNTRRDDALIHDRYRRGFIVDDAVADENIDRTSLRRQADHFANSQSDEHRAKVAHGFLGDGGLFTSSKGQQLDRRKQIIDRENLENDHLTVQRNAGSMTNAQEETGSRSGRTAYRAALGGPFTASDTAYDMAEFNRIDAERLGRSTDYVKDADRTLRQYDKGLAERSAEAGVLIEQDGGLGGGSDGYETGSAKTERETGTILSQTLLEKGGANKDFHKGHDAVGRARSKRASTGFGPDGAVAADLTAEQDSWDRGNLDRRDQVRFLHSAHDRLADISKEKSKADVDLKITIGEAVPGDINCADRRARAADAYDRMIERDAGDSLITNAESETIQNFDIGGQTTIAGNGVAIGVPAIA